ncbi:hypothetical protein BDV06DRAFT_225636 [Aspergillus oleicola]
MTIRKSTAQVEGDAQKNEAPQTLSSVKNLTQIAHIAAQSLSKETWSFNYAAAGDHISKTMEAEVYCSIFLRPRIFRDVRECDISTTMLGNNVGFPVFASPMAMALRFHQDGEKGVTEACREFGAMHVISNNASMPVEEIVKDAGPDQVFGFQIYIQRDRAESEALLERIHKIDKIKCLFVTVDEPVIGKHEVDQAGHDLYEFLNSGRTEALKERGGIKLGMPFASGPAADLTWQETLDWLTAHTDLPIVLKGVQTHEDAMIASVYAPQIKGMMLSNHGGRVLDTAPPAICTLLEIRRFCPEVFDKLEVFVDGGISRGTDVVKAMCLGAKAVGIGRPVLWGLGAGGAEGVKRTFEILANEIKSSMQILGVQKVSDLGTQHVNCKRVEGYLYDGRV